MRRTLSVGAAATVLLVVALAPAGAVSADSQLEVRVEPLELTVDVGERVELTVTVTNRSTEPSAPLAAHLDITDPTGSESVDPEDWTATLTRQVGVLEGGATETITWPMTPISGGSFVAYVLLIPTEGEQVLTASNVVGIVVDERRTLNPQGVLPVAAGAPVLIGLLLVGQRWRARRED